MKRILPYYVFLFILLPLTSLAQKVFSIKIDGSINPVSADFIHRSIAKTQSENAACLIIQLNTPGGLLKSTRAIVGDILESPVPVIVYVSPGGAHAGSAGVFITMAASIAAMAPGTNIGAAHPVALQSAMDSVMTEKATNDAAAFIRTIAEKRNRNLQWAEEAVRKSLAITETEALAKKVIDMVARNEQELLNQVDGRKVELNTGTVILHTKGASIETISMGFSEKLLDIVSNPDIAYILLLFGLYGILFELYNPGAILPGIVGVIALILAFYSMHSLPINYAGLALIIFAIILFLLEIKIVSHGVLAIGGAFSLLLGSMMLIRPSSSLELVKLSRTVIASFTAVTTLFFLFVIGLGLKAQRRKVVTGIESLRGAIASVLNTLDPDGTVTLHGEVWNAVSTSGKIDKGENVRVTAMKNLTLYVERINTSIIKN